MTSYNVTARHWENRLWELHITDDAGEDFGATQARKLTEAEAMVRDYLQVLEVPGADAAAITINPELKGLTGRVKVVRRKTHAAAVAQRTAGEESRALARDLVTAGLTGSEVGVVLGVSKARVSQLLRS